MLSPLASTLLLALCAAAAAAQELRWKLPPHGAAIYRRELRTAVEVEPKGAGAGVPWGGDANAAVVLADELDAKGQRTTEPPLDLRDLFPTLALDLSCARATKTKLELTGSGRSQPAVVEVTYGAPTDTGAQSIEAVIAPAKVERKPTPASWQPAITGSVRGTRTIDRANGRVQSLQATIELLADYAAMEQRTAQRVRVQGTDSWTFDRLLAPGDAEFRTMVSTGIRKAVGAIRKDLQRMLGQPARPADDPYHDVRPGELALALLALVKGGDDPRDLLLQRGYGELRRRAIDGTYSLACAILAVEALYTPPSEWQLLREGRLPAPMARELTADDRALVQGWTDALLLNIDSSAGSPYLRRWHYGPSTAFDNSNTQYAMLGLYAAQLCGIEVSAAVWTAAANHWLQVKIDNGEPGAPRLTTHGELERQSKGNRTVAGGGKIPAYGWAYGARGQPTGSMTCAGVSGLTLCAAALRGQKKPARKFLAEVDDAARGGLLWLERNLSVRRNPGPAEAWSSWFYYYLYGLERTCELNQVALLGDQDWYFDGAMQLLLQQRTDGAWGSAWDTCFALLFLKKTALPTITGR